MCNYKVKKSKSNWTATLCRLSLIRMKKKTGINKHLDVSDELAKIIGTKKGQRVIFSYLPINRGKICFAGVQATGGEEAVRLHQHKQSQGIVVLYIEKFIMLDRTLRARPTSRPTRLCSPSLAQVSRDTSGWPSTSKATWLTPRSSFEMDSWWQLLLRLICVLSPSILVFEILAAIYSFKTCKNR